MISPCLSCVRALNALQNSMMFTPCWPSAGPTGGAGFAAPAGHCSLTTATTFFATLASRGSRSGLLELRVVELHRRGPTEHLHHHPDLLLVRSHLVDEALEVGERPAHDADVLPLLEPDLRLGLGRSLLDLLGHARHFFVADRRRLVTRAAHEAGDARRAPHDVPGLVVEDHAHEDVAGEELALRRALLPLDHLDHLLLGDQDLVEQVLLAERA